MASVNDNAMARANQNAKKATQLPESTQLAIITALPNIVNGAFWGFTTIAEAKKHEDAFKADKNILARKLGNACLIEVNPDYLCKAVKMVDSNIITDADIATMQRGMAEAKAQFEKFLANKGSDEDNYSGTVGIYCTNDSTSITHKGMPYPAFRISIGTFLALCNKWGYMVSVGDKYVTPQEAQASAQALWSSMVLSPTNTGIFINIKSTFPKAQVKEMKKQLKASQK